MKTRQGFVSNSSTTSFCIYGVAVKEKKLMSIIGREKKPDEIAYECDHEFDRKNFKYCPECGKSSKSFIVEDEGMDFEEIIEALEKFGLDAQQDCEGDYWYIGCELGGKMKKDEKLNMVKNYNEKLAKLFPNIEPEFHTYCSDGG